MKKVIAIVGPTAIGKTKISIELAKRFNLEIISGDSVAVYKKLDIGSAKPTKEEMCGVKHHLIDVLEPTKQYDVSMFQKMSREVIDNLGCAIICGGTGLYIQSALFDYNFDAPKRDESFIDRFKDVPNEELYNYLLKLDPNIDREKIHPNNRKRVLRAIQVKEDTNVSIHENLKKNEKVYDSYIVYLNLEDRELLYERINKRVDQMMNEGLINEVKSLYDEGIMPHAIGYREFIPYFTGEESLETCVEEIKKNSRHLAKRQITWFKNQMDTHFYNVNLENINQTIDIIENDIKEFLAKESE